MNALGTPGFANILRGRGEPAQAGTPARTNVSATSHARSIPHIRHLKSLDEPSSADFNDCVNILNVAKR
jgi:hypothetical protein